MCSHVNYINLMISIKTLIVVLLVIFVIAFLLQRDHLLTTLILLEACILVNLCFLFYYILRSCIYIHIFLIVLAFAAAEAAIGLSILVSIIRLNRNDLRKRVFILFAHNS